MRLDVVRHGAAPLEALLASRFLAAVRLLSGVAARVDLQVVAAGEKLVAVGGWAVEAVSRVGAAVAAGGGYSGSLEGCSFFGR